MLRLNNRGQSLVEYLILVSLMAVGTIGVVRILNKTVQVNFANITAALQGQTKVAEHEKINKNDYKKRDMSDFMSGAATNKNE